MSQILQNLNEAQQAAVQSTEGPLLVLAGAGAGKTRVITHRIAYLLEVAHVAPNNILAVTFTNKAAGEMKSRLYSLVGAQSRHVWMGTFHSVGLAILRRFGEKTVCGTGFSIVDQDDRTSLVREVTKILGIDPKKYSPKLYQRLISEYKNTIAFVENREPEDYTHRFKEVFALYEKELRRQKLIDFDDMLSLSLRLFVQDSEVLAYYRELCRYILVDEYQDTNVIQFAFLKELAGESGNICVVGDDDQAIYGWRGAEVENILYFDRHFRHVKEIKLVDNYRSAPQILSVANRLIHHNADRRGKDLAAKSARNGEIVAAALPDERVEAEHVADLIEAHIRRGTPPSEIAVLYRTNAQSRNFEVALNKRRIVYRVVGGVGFYQRREIKDILSYLRLYDNPYDEAAFGRVAKTPPKGVGDKLVETVMQYALVNHLDILSACDLLIPTLRGRQATGLSIIRNIMHNIVTAESIAEMVDMVLSGSDYKEYLAQIEEPEEAKARLENIYELYNAAKIYEEQSEMPSLSEFLSTTTLTTSTDEDAGESIRLMSMHAAKGLEFEAVFLTGLEEGIFPLSSQDGEDNLEEERRLAYVGITRAKIYLSFSHVVSRMVHGKRQLMRPSRFLKEAGVASNNAKAATNEAFMPTDGRLRKGMAVSHELFGTGVIMNVEGSGDNAKVDVFFKKNGMKKLVARFLKS
jgi:DNA helicase-2/ATP-dependent DNA helicase PcrA